MKRVSLSNAWPVRPLTRLTASTIITLIACLLATLYIYTGIEKLSKHIITVEQISQITFLKNVAPYIAWTLPVVEIGIAILLVIPKLRLLGFFLTLLSLTLFTSYIITLTFYSTDPNCGCGGFIENLSWQAHLLLNMALMTLAVSAIYLRKKAT